MRGVNRLAGVGTALLWIIMFALGVCCYVTPADMVSIAVIGGVGLYTLLAVIRHNSKKGIR